MSANMDALLARAAPLIRLPDAPDHVPEVAGGGAGLRCPVTGRLFPLRAGVLQLLATDMRPTITQRSLDTALTAWLYDRGRDALLRVFGLPDFAAEVGNIQQRLLVGTGDVVLDLACGHGNFTVEWARLAGPTGLVIGVDIAAAMMQRAADRVQSLGLPNILLLRADAQRLPFAAHLLQKVNCSGGFHQFPDLPLALREITRVSAPGALLTASMFAENPDHQHTRAREWLRRRFALHFVPLLWLGKQLEALGYVDYRWSVPGGGFGYISARKSA